MSILLINSNYESPLGASNVIFDTVILANCLFAMKDSSYESITGAFKEYQELRFPYAQVSFNSSSGMAKILNGQVTINFFIIVFTT